MRKWNIVLCTLLAGVLLFFASAAAQSNASIKIVKPGDRRNVPVGENEVQVQISGVNLADGYKWELFVDGVSQGVVRDKMTTQVNLDKPMVLRRMKAVLYDTQGAEIASNEILIVAVKMESTADVFNRSWFVPFMFVFMLGIVVLILVALRLRPRIKS